MHGCRRGTATLVKGIAEITEILTSCEEIAAELQQEDGRPRPQGSTTLLY